MLNIIYKDIKELIPYDKNPRNNAGAVEVVKNSIKEFGFKVPIIIDTDNVIVAGHTRLLAAKKLKMKQVPCIVADDLTEEQVKAFRLADNKVSEFAEWDYNLLAGELFMVDLDMSLFGFEDDAVEDEGYGTEFELNSGGKGNLEQITFTLENGQAEIIKDLLKEIQGSEDFKEYHEVQESNGGNTNKNGNALSYIIADYLNGRS